MVFESNGVKTALVIIPHQDDEINLMGGLLPLLIENGIDVHFVYMTNGDIFFNGKVRIAEAIAALSWLGIKGENVHFLGYPDASDKFGRSLYRSDKVVSTKYGCSTYGSGLVNDYAFLAFGEHSDYTYSNLKRDLRDCILKVSPEVIFVTDFDGHHDHRLLVMAFDEVMNDVLQNSDIDFHPYVYKGFAYSTAFKGNDDFYCLNPKDTAKPGRCNNALNTVTELDNPVLSWFSRVQFPVSLYSVVGNVLRDNILYKAMNEHRSQCVSLRAKRILNADKVFWERPTNNLIYKAELSATSGDVSHLLNFKLFDVEDISEMVEPLQFEFIGWKPALDDSERVLYIKFDVCEEVKFLNLYVHSISDVDVKVCINNDIVLNIKDFDVVGKKYCYIFNETISVKTICFMGLPDSAMLLYVEILPDGFAPFRYAKLKLNGNFAYKYLLDGSDISLDYEIYSYGFDVAMLRLVSDISKVSLNADSCKVPREVKRFHLSIVDEVTGTVYDTVSVERLNVFAKFFKLFVMLLDYFYVKLVHRFQKFKRSKMKMLHFDEVKH